MRFKICLYRRRISFRPIAFRQAIKSHDKRWCTLLFELLLNDIASGTMEGLLYKPCYELRDNKPGQVPTYRNETN